MQTPEPEGVDRRVEGGRADSLVLGEQVIRELVEIRDTADHRRACDDVVAVDGELCEELRVFGVAFDQAVVRIVVKCAPHRAVLAEVVDTDNLVAGVNQLGDEISADESGRAGD